MISSFTDTLLGSLLTSMLAGLASGGVVSAVMSFYLNTKLQTYMQQYTSSYKVREEIVGRFIEGTRQLKELVAKEHQTAAVETEKEREVSELMPQIAKAKIYFDEPTCQKFAAVLAGLFELNRLTNNLPSLHGPQWREIANDHIEVVWKRIPEKEAELYAALRGTLLPPEGKNALRSLSDFHQH